MWLNWTVNLSAILVTSAPLDHSNLRSLKIEHRTSNLSRLLNHLSAWALLICLQPYALDSTCIKPLQLILMLLKWLKDAHRFVIIAFLSESDLVRLKYAASYKCTFYMHIFRHIKWRQFKKLKLGHHIAYQKSDSASNFLIFIVLKGINSNSSQFKSF